MIIVMMTIYINIYVCLEEQRLTNGFTFMKLSGSNITILSFSTFWMFVRYKDILREKKLKREGEIKKESKRGEWGNILSGARERARYI